MGRLALLARNSTANVLRAGSTSLLQVVLPLILLTLVPKEAFSVWAIAFSLAAFIPLLDFGLQTTVQVLVGRYSVLGENRSTLVVLKRGLQIGAIISICTIALFIIIGYNAQRIFPGIPAGRLREFASVVTILAVGQCAILVSNLVSSYYAGLQRTMDPVVIIAGSRVISAVVTIALGIQADLLLMSIGYSVPLLVGLAALFIWRRREWRLPRYSRAGDVSYKSLLIYTYPLAVWSIASVAVGSIGAFVTARVSYENVAIYSVIAALISATAGLQSSLLGPMVPELSRRFALGLGLKDLIFSITRLNSAAVFLVGCGFASMLPILLELLGHNESHTLFLFWPASLLIAAAMRLVATPITMLFVSTGVHRKLVFPPLVDAIVTTMLTWVLGHEYGILGISAGLFGGSIFGSSVTIWWSVVRSRLEDIRGVRMISSMLWWPILCWSPVLLVNVFRPLAGGGLYLQFALSIACVAMAASCHWKWVLVRDDRMMLIGLSRIVWLKCSSRFSAMQRDKLSK
jgi:O-antigen/teichoic acid export membrane protein